MSASPVLATFSEALLHPAPWLTPYRSVGRTVLADAQAQGIVEALNRQRDATHGVRFVSHSALTAQEPYEAFIARTREVPTRDNLHDLFNGLVWLTFPRTKRRLNELQAAEIERLGIGAQRGPLRDALTVFDENAAVLSAPMELVESLRRRDWHSLFVTHRELWEVARVVIFGHALLEKMLQPRKAITAHVWLVDTISDEAIAASLTSDRVRTKAFLPLPVLGIPGWCDQNVDPDFYADAAVFRVAR